MGQIKTALIGCERSGIIRDALRAVGVDAWSCDLEPCEGNPGFHYQADLFKVVEFRKFDLLIVHPECRYLSVSGLHWNKRVKGRARKTVQALRFARKCFELCENFPFAVLENPVSILSTRCPKYTKLIQIIQPYDFGEDASKKTCLWLFNLPKLLPTKRVPGRLVWKKGKQIERWSNQTDSGQNKLAPKASRSMDRARTYPGIAKAMAEQWVIGIGHNGELDFEKKVAA